MPVRMSGLPAELWTSGIITYLDSSEIVNLAGASREIRNALQAINQHSRFDSQMPSVYDQAWFQCLSRSHSFYRPSRKLSIFPSRELEQTLAVNKASGRITRVSKGGDTICNATLFRFSDKSQTPVWKIEVWKRPSSQEAYERVLISEIQEEGHTLVLDQAGKYLCLGGNGRIFMWDLTEKPPKKDPYVLEGHTGSVKGLTFFNQGRYLLTAGSWKEDTLCVWDLSSHTGSAPPRSLNTMATGSIEPISCVAASEDGSRAYTVTREGTIQIWDLKSCSPFSLATLVLPPFDGLPPELVILCPHTKKLIVHRTCQVNIVDVNNDQLREISLIDYDSSWPRGREMAVEEGLLYVRDPKSLEGSGCQMEFQVWDLKETPPQRRTNQYKGFNELGPIEMGMEDGDVTIYNTSSLYSFSLIPSTVEDELSSIVDRLARERVDLGSRFSPGLCKKIYQQLYRIHKERGVLPSCVPENYAEQSFKGKSFPASGEECALACESYYLASSIQDWISIFENSLEKAFLRPLIRRVSGLRSLRSKVYDALYHIHRDKLSSVPPNYGELAFRNEGGYSATHQERAEALRKAFPDLVQLKAVQADPDSTARDEIVGADSDGFYSCEDEEIE